MHCFDNDFHDLNTINILPNFSRVPKKKQKYFFDQ